MKRKKILFLTNVITPYMDDLFNNLAEYKEVDFEVAACAYKEPDREWDLKYLDAARYKYFVLKDSFLFQIPKQIRFVYFGGLSLLKRLISEKYDAVVFKGGTRFIGPFYACIARLLGMNTVLWEENSIATTDTLLKKVFKALYVNKLLFSNFIVYGTPVKELILKFNPNSEDKIHFAYSPIDNDKYRNSYLRLKNKKNLIKKSLGIGLDEKVVLYIGRFVSEKNLPSLIDAFAIMAKASDEKIKGLIVGGGMLKDQLQDQINRLNLNDMVSLINFQEFNKIAMFYAIADVFVLPSEREAWGLVINEAMNFKLPIVVSDKVGCAVDLVKNNYNGFVYDVNNTNALAESILNALENSTQMGENSFNIIKDVNFDQISKVIIGSVFEK